MTAQSRLRQWSAGASAIAQVAATAAGMLPWWALPLTLGLTLIVSRPAEGPVDPARTRLIRGAGVAGVGIFAVLIAFKTVGAGSDGADPTATLRSLTEALVVLSLVMAPSARTPREYRVWLTVTTGVLVAAAAGGRSGSSATLSVLSWIILLTAITQVQSAAAVADGAVAAVAVAGPRPAPPQQSRLLGAVIPVVASLVAGALVFFALPAGLGGEGLAKKIAGHVNGNTQNQTANRDSVGVDTYGDGELSLLVRGTLPDTPMIDVPAASPALWRGTFYSIYTGHSWVANDDQQLQYVRGNSTDIPSSAVDPAPGGRVQTDAVAFAPGFTSSLLWAPGVPLHVKGIDGSITAVSRESANTRLISAARLSSYQVTSAVATTTPRRLRSASGPDLADPQWTQLPPELPATVGQLARQITSRATTRYDQVRAVESYLRSHETYTQSSPVPATGDDAVADFLFRDHEGFCEQFASAEAVLLRTVGVPTRVVTGLAYGTDTGNTRLYTAANAHAWDEVYYPGVGWSPSDPTFGATVAPATSSHRSLFGRVVRALAADIPGGRTALGVVIFALLVGAGGIARAALRSRGGGDRRRGAGQAQQIGPVLAAFYRFAGHPRAPAPRAVTETAREYLSRVSPPGTLDAATATLEQECYAATPPEPAAATAAVAAFAAVTGQGQDDH